MRPAFAAGCSGSGTGSEYSDNHGMIRNPYRVGDAVLALRGTDGEGHEPGTVVDAYSLIIGSDERPMVVVEFADGQRAYLQADGADVRPAEELEGDAEPGEDAAAS
jgi:hypothetical protein